MAIMVLKNVNLSAKKGEIVTLVGKRMWKINSNQDSVIFNDYNGILMLKGRTPGI